MDCSASFLLSAGSLLSDFPSFIFQIFLLPSPKGANVNNRWWNDRRSCNLRTSWCSLPIVPGGGESHPLFLLFAPFGDGGTDMMDQSFRK